MRDITKVFLDDHSVKAPAVRRGRAVTKQEAYDLGCVGPMLRASGVAQDMRQLGYAAFNEIPVEPVIRTEGDSYARCAVRCEELFQSVDIIRQALAKIPAGEIAVKVTGNPNGENHRPHRATARRGGLPHQGERHQEPAALPGAHADLCQSAGDVEGAAGLRAGRRAGDCADDRPLHQLHGKVIWPTSK